MKKSTALFLFTLIASSLFSQNAFIKYFGQTSTYQAGQQVIADNDGNLVIAGVDQTSPYERGNFFLTKLKADGTVIWTRIQHSNESNERLNTLIQTADGGFMIGGGQVVSPFVFTEDEVVIVKVDGAGYVQWTKNYGKGRIEDIVQLPDDGYVASIGLVDSSGITYFHVVRMDAAGDIIWLSEGYFTITKLLLTGTGNIFFVFGGRAALMTPDGTVLWDKLFAVPGSYGLATCATQLSNGQFLVHHGANNGELLTWLDENGNTLTQKLVGTEVFPSPREIVVQTSGELVLLSQENLARYDEQGNLLDEVRFGESPLETTTQGLDLALLPNDDLAITGIYRDYSNGFDPFVARILPELQLDWLQVMGDHLPGSIEMGYASVATPDAGSLTVGTKAFLDKSNDFYFVKTDALGNVQWEANYGSNDVEFVGSLTALSDGGFLLTGISINYDNDATFLILLRLDANGNYVWEKKYNYSNQPLSYDIIAEELPNSELVIIFNFYQGVPKFMRTDAHGNSLLVKSLGNVGAYYDSKLTSDGNILLTGFRPNGSFAVVTKIDTNGNSLFSTSISPNAADFGQGLGIEEASDGGALVLSKVRFVYRDTVLFSKLDASGNVEWSKMFSPSQAMNGDETYAPNLAKTSDGNYLMSILSYHESTVDGNLVYLIKVDEQGNEIWSTSLDYELYDEVIADLDVVDNDCLLFTGYAYSYEHNDLDMLLVKTLPDGAVNTIQLKSLGEMVLSPNPSLANLSVQFQSTANGPISIEVIQSATGHSLHRFVSYKHSWDWKETYLLSDLPPGIYPIRLTVGSRSIVQAWVKQ